MRLMDAKLLASGSAQTSSNNWSSQAAKASMVGDDNAAYQ
jgi:hypothetical protein